MKHGKVLNIIKGYTVKYDIEEVTIIDDANDRVLYSGEIDKFLFPDDLMQNDAYRIKMTTANRVLNFNNRKLFIFI